MSRVIKGNEDQPSLFSRALNSIGVYTKSQYNSVKSISLSDIISSAYTSQAQGVTSNFTYKTAVSMYKAWVYTCINRKAMTVAKLPLELSVFKKEGKKLKGSNVKGCMKHIKTNYEKKLYLKANGIQEIRIFDHPFLTLINNPNTLDTRFNLWVNTVTRLELWGVCGILINKNSLKIPAELWTLPLTNTAVLSAIPDAKTVVKGYRYRDGTVNQTFELDELMYIKYVNPGNPYTGYSPIQAQLYPYDIDLFLSQTLHSIFQNKASFGNVFTTDKRMSKKQVDEIREQISAQLGGVLNAGKALFAHSGMKLDNTKVGGDVSAFPTEQISSYTQDKMFSSLGLSAGKLGLVKDVNRANMEALDKTYIEDTIQPLTMLIEEYYERDILPLYDESLTLNFKLPKTSDREVDVKQDEMNLKYGKNVINELRERDGEQPVPWGNVPVMIVQAPRSMSQVIDESGNIKPPEIIQPPTQKTISTESHFDFMTKSLDKGFWTNKMKRKSNEFFIKSIEQNKKHLVKVMKQHFKRQEKETLARLNKYGKALQGSIQGFGSTKKMKWLMDHKDKLSDINIDKKEEATKLMESAGPSIELIVEEAGNLRLASFGITSPIDLNDPEVEKWLSNKLRLFSKEVEGTTFGNIQSILREGFQEGLPLTQISDNLKEMFASAEKYRSLTIARTETISASNFGDLQSVKQNKDLKNELEKFWINENGARDTHLIAGSEYDESSAISVDKNFDVGEGSGPAPGNIGLAEEDINCRCNIGYVRKQK